MKQRARFLAGLLALALAFLAGRWSVKPAPCELRAGPLGWVQVWRSGSLAGEFCPADGEAFDVLDGTCRDGGPELRPGLRPPDPMTTPNTDAPHEPHQAPARPRLLPGAGQV